jgi:hypothetical protein
MVGSGCRYCNPQEYIDHLEDQIDDDQLEAQRVPGWVSVKDWLPPLRFKVLLFANGVVQEDTYILDQYDDEDLCTDDLFWDRHDIDEIVYLRDDHYWMPLPSPPTGGEK